MRGSCFGKASSAWFSFVFSAFIASVIAKKLASFVVSASALALVCGSIERGCRCP